MVTRIIGFRGRRRRLGGSGGFRESQFVLHPMDDAAAVSTVVVGFDDFRLDFLQPTVDAVFHRRSGFLDFVAILSRGFCGRMSDDRNGQ